MFSSQYAILKLSNLRKKTVPTWLHHIVYKTSVNIRRARDAVVGARYMTVRISANQIQERLQLIPTYFSIFVKDEHIQLCCKYECFFFCKEYDLTATGGQIYLQWCESGSSRIPIILAPRIRIKVAKNHGKPT